MFKMNDVLSLCNICAWETKGFNFNVVVQKQCEMVGGENTVFFFTIKFLDNRRAAKCIEFKKSKKKKLKYKKRKPFHNRAIL